MQPIRGFSIVELMVGLVISMVVSLAVFQTFAMFEGQKRTTTSASDAQTSGLVALQSLERDLKAAGDGLANRWLQGCAQVFQSFNGAAIPNFSLAAVSIINGAGTAPDTIIMRRGDSLRNNGALKLETDMAAFGSPLQVTNPMAINVGDQIVVADSPGNCTLMQVSGITQFGGGAAQLEQAVGAAYPFNSAGAPAATPGPAAWTPHASTAQIFNVGTLLLRTYSLNANALQSQDFPAATGLAVASDIVQLQAQYGVDAAGADESVDCWTDAVSGGCGLAVPPIPAQFRLIKAVRVAIVARSALQEKVDATSGVCEATPTTAWPSGGQPVWGGPVAGGVVLNLSADPNWRCYRYRVYQTTVPLRNVVWGNVS
jgi:type IV pilus assembly protein PilW